MKIILILLVCVALTISADTRVQSNWYSGPGAFGPVSQWTDVFYQADGICYTAMYDTLLLGMTASTQMVLPPGSGWGTDLLSADFDCDGDVDLSCFLEQLPNGLQLFLIENVDGAGTSWTLHRVSDIPIFPHRAATGDVNGDGYPDVLAGEVSFPRQLRLYINSGGTSPWNEYVMYDEHRKVRFVDIADADGDGDQDLFFSLWPDSMLAWIENTGTTPGPGWPIHEIEIDKSLQSMDAVDIDQDGDIDVIACEIHGSFIFLENVDGSGLLWNERYIWLSSPYCCAVADIDGDGDLDLIGRLNQWFENIDGAGHTWQVHHTHLLAFHVFAANLNGDDYIDFIMSAIPIVDNPGFTALINRIPEGGRLLRSNYNDGFWPSGAGVITIDVDGDGIDEVAASSNFDNGLFIWGFLGFEEDGCLESSVLNTGYDLINWDSFSWSADVPSGTSVCFQIRGSDDYNQMGEWSDTLYTSGSGIGDILQPEDRYFQYRAILSTTDIWNSACLDEVMVSFNPLSVDPGLVNENLFTISANPSGSVPVFDITLAESCNVKLQLFDISGRMVSTVFMGDLPAGMHSLYSGELITGIYIARLSLNYEMSTLSFIVLGE